MLPRVNARRALVAPVRGFRLKSSLSPGTIERPPFEDESMQCAAVITAVGLMKVPVHTPTELPRKPTSLTTVGKSFVGKPLTICRQDFPPVRFTAGPLDGSGEVRVELFLGDADWLHANIVAMFKAIVTRRKDIGHAPRNALASMGYVIGKPWEILRFRYKRRNYLRKIAT
jgi:hypothetical protein